MKLLLNNVTGSDSFEVALNALCKDASGLSVAVSYLQVSGWRVLDAASAHINANNIRLICTDQFCITQPAALRQARDRGVQLLNFNGGVTFHPKVVIANDAVGSPIRAIVGSANLSSPALISSVEAGLLITDTFILAELQKWFELLFSDRARLITDDELEQMEERWKAVAATRVRNTLTSYPRLQRRRTPRVPPVATSVQIAEALEDILSTLQDPIVLLNFDQAGNNIRNLNNATTQLQMYANCGPVTSKAKNELNLLGFVKDGSLTTVGSDAAGAQSPESFALIWCRWLATSRDSDLEAVNYRLPGLKRALTRFWTMDEEVRLYFFGNSRNPLPDVRPVIQMIELLCNGSELASELKLSEIRALAKFISSSDDLPPAVRDTIAFYLSNKGSRSWDSADRSIVPNAWLLANTGKR